MRLAQDIPIFWPNQREITLRSIVIPFFLLLSSSSFITCIFIYYSILSRVWSVTIDGFWIDDRIIGLFDTARDYILQFTRTRVHGHIFTSRCSVAAFNGGRSPSSGFPKLWPASDDSFSHQQVTTTKPQQFTHWLTESLTNQLTPLQ
jgi:hypothetical protein